MGLHSAESADEPEDRVAAEQTAWEALTGKNHSAVSVFRPEALLREARRQRGLSLIDVPAVCVLDPDGDVVRQVKRAGVGRSHQGWACYHTELFSLDLDGIGEVGIVGLAVGAPFAVLVAEQLFVSGCRLLLSVTSAGQISDNGPPPYFVLIDRALRDEGTSHHYLPPSIYADAPDSALLAHVENSLSKLPDIVSYRGTSWTTDAPYRETEAAIEAARRLGALAVEMEAAALYAFAAAKQQAVLCFAHVTNSMAQSKGDFEKGEADGSVATLAVIAAAARAWFDMATPAQPPSGGGPAAMPASTSPKDFKEATAPSPALPIKSAG